MSKGKYLLEEWLIKYFLKEDYYYAYFNKKIYDKIVKYIDNKQICINILLIMTKLIYKDILNINIRNNIDYNTFLKESYESIDLAYINSFNFIKICESQDLIHFESSIDYNLTMPKISVVISLFNCEKYILRSIKSIQLQNLSNFEIILIDDKSEDNNKKSKEYGNSLYKKHRSINV